MEKEQKSLKCRCLNCLYMNDRLYSFLIYYSFCFRRCSKYLAIFIKSITVALHFLALATIRNCRQSLTKLEVESLWSLANSRAQVQCHNQKSRSLHRSSPLKKIDNKLNHKSNQEIFSTDSETLNCMSGMGSKTPQNTILTHAVSTRQRCFAMIRVLFFCLVNFCFKGYVMSGMSNVVLIQCQVFHTLSSNRNIQVVFVFFI